MKNDVIEKVYYIETKYPINEIKYGELFLWPYIRLRIFNAYAFSDSCSKKNTNLKLSNVKARILILANIFKGFFIGLFHTSIGLLFKRNSSLIVTSSGETRTINNRKADKTFCCLNELLEDILPIVYESKESVSSYPHYISQNFINFFIYLTSLFVKIDKSLLQKKDLVDQICIELGISLNFSLWLKVILGAHSFYRFWLRRIHPKRIFLTCYYDIDRMSMIHAAKELAIPVVEFQHGMITPEHYAYNMFNYSATESFPDYLFSYGTYTQTAISENIFKKQNIKVVGNLHLEFIKGNSVENRHLFLKKYKTSVDGKLVITVASAYTVDKDLISFCSDLARLNKNLCIIYKPRPFFPYQDQYASENFFIEKDMDTYICMQNSTALITVYSTCALEALALGIPVLCVDINGLATTYYKNILGSMNSVRFIKHQDEIMSALKDFEKLDKREIEKDGAYFYASNHKLLLKQALDEIHVV